MDTHRDDVWRFVRAVAGSQDAEDCFQETFLAALRAYPDLRDGSNLKGWLMTIAYRKAVDAQRARGRHPAPTNGVPDRAIPPSEAMDDELWGAVRSLPPMQRAAVAYRFVNDLAYKDIAEVLACSEDSARQNVRVGLRKLREVLSDDA